LKRSHFGNEEDESSPRRGHFAVDSLCSLHAFVAVLVQCAFCCAYSLHMLVTGKTEYVGNERAESLSRRGHVCIAHWKRDTCLLFTRKNISETKETNRRLVEATCLICLYKTRACAYWCVPLKMIADAYWCARCLHEWCVHWIDACLLERHAHATTS